MNLSDRDGLISNLEDGFSIDAELGSLFLDFDTEEESLPHFRDIIVEAWNRSNFGEKFTQIITMSCVQDVTHFFRSELNLDLEVDVEFELAEIAITKLWFIGFLETSEYEQLLSPDYGDYLCFEDEDKFREIMQAAWGRLVDSVIPDELHLISKISELYNPSQPLKKFQTYIPNLTSALNSYRNFYADDADKVLLHSLVFNLFKLKNKTNKSRILAELLTSIDEEMRGFLSKHLIQNRVNTNPQIGLVTGSSMPEGRHIGVV